MVTPSDGKYRQKLVSIVAILRYPSKNPHHELHIHIFVTYFDVFQLSDFKFFRNFGFFRHLPVSAPFWVISLKFFFLAFLVTIPMTIPSINTEIKYRYSTIPKGIDTVSIVSILFRTTSCTSKEPNPGFGHMLVKSTTWSHPVKKTDS